MNIRAVGGGLGSVLRVVHKCFVPSSEHMVLRKFLKRDSKGKSKLVAARSSWRLVRKRLRGGAGSAVAVGVVTHPVEVESKPVASIVETVLSRGSVRDYDEWQELVTHLGFIPGGRLPVERHLATPSIATRKRYGALKPKPVPSRFHETVGVVPERDCMLKPAVIIPSGEGKTTLVGAGLKGHFKVFYDFDDREKLGRVDRDVMVGDAFMVRSVIDWDRLGKSVLLVRSAGDVPEGYQVVGAFALCHCDGLHPHVDRLLLGRPTIRYGLIDRNLLPRGTVCCSDYQQRDRELQRLLYTMGILVDYNRNPGSFVVEESVVEPRGLLASLSAFLTS